MSEVIPERVTADVDGDFVVFRIGMRANVLWKVHRWLPVFLAMPRMLSELEADPESGLLGYQTDFGVRTVTMTQYWRSFEDLREYARDSDGEHLPAWQRYNQEFGSSDDVGIWHETFLVREDEYEAVYNNMPPYGLGDVAELIPASGREETAAGRLGKSDGDDAAVTESGTVVTDE